MVDCSLIDSSDSDIKLPDNNENFFATHRDFTAAAQPLQRRLSPSSYRPFLDAADFVKGSEWGEIIDAEFFEGISKKDARALLAEFRGLLRSPSSDG